MEGEPMIMNNSIIREDQEMPSVYLVMVRDVVRDGWWRQVTITKDREDVDQHVRWFTAHSQDVRVLTYEGSLCAAATFYPESQEERLRLIK
jgi:hypothetical protein